MITAEAYTRKTFENASEDFVRGAVWACKKIYELVPHDPSMSPGEHLELILNLEKTFPDYIEAEKESFEFNRGATWGLETFALRVAKDRDLAAGDILTIIGSYGVDFIQNKEDILGHYRSLPPEEQKPDVVDRIVSELEWAKEIDANKGW